MAVAAHPGNGAFVDRVADLVASAGRGGELRAAFARLMLAQADESELEAYQPKTLAALAISGFEFAATRKAKHHRIRAFNTDKIDTPHGEVTIIEILNDDMPFLVDSVMGEIFERGMTVHFVVHPILEVVRDSNGKLRSVAAPGEGGEGIRESYIHIHVDRIDSEAERNDLKRSLSDILTNVRIVVRDWKPMLDRMNRAIAAYTESPPPVAVPDLAESIQFLRWLADNNFTFLGMRAMAYVGGARHGRLEPAPDSGLGLLRDPDVAVLKRGGQSVGMTPEIRKFFLEPEPLIITKANVHSTVHRRAHMDYIGVKIYAENGEISGELRIVGLFTSAAYTRSVKSIPFLRHKVEQVIRRSGVAPLSHNGKALLNVLETYPRDELFQIGVKRLTEFALAILNLELKPRVRVFARPDEFDRFVSVLVYVPRDRFSTETRMRIGDFLAEAYRGHVAYFQPFFPEGRLVRIHFIIGRDEGKTPVLDQEQLEAEVARIVRTWRDEIRDRVYERFEPAEATRLLQRYSKAFPAGYRETMTIERAFEDVARLEQLGPERPLAIDFYRQGEGEKERLRVAIYHLGGPIPLSRRVPILENLGFDVIDERSHLIRPRNEAGEKLSVSLHDMIVVAQGVQAAAVHSYDRRLEDCFCAVCTGAASNDAFNRLILAAGLDWREVSVMRAYGSYLRQIRAPFGQAYLADTLVRHPAVTRDLVALFRLMFDPSADAEPAQRKAESEAIVQQIERALEAIPSLDEDRIIRHYRNLICSTLRTNFYQRDERGQPSTAVAFKLDSAALDGAPFPRPLYEVFVFSPRAEGIHLRGGRIARGGIRWSDRLQDFRTEVLSLAKAQQVKNAVIIPTGAKGGFVPKLLPIGASRETIQAEGVASYQLFVSTLLSLTDNLKDGKVAPPAQVVRHDDDDPYLVVAADKGTATFSDIANEISLRHGFWLGDAFASGGSAGYDHKKMAITARGAWEAVKRHFREMDIDIQSTPFTVIGVGDMSGDVFGNGMLLAKTIRLVAAFDHRDIFIDPNPDPESSWVERKRLFDLPRTSWADYNADLISEGGGVFSRQAKSIKLSPQMRELLGADTASLTPVETIRAILKAPTDLIWFGGIGTYVKAEIESDADVGDRANDALRVHAEELRAHVVGEGANLAMTQRARIAFARAGGKVNTDAIDNSAGVNSSDQEVNIKIALGPALNSGKLDLAKRNTLLVEMTDDVAAAVLRNNYLQTLALSLGERRGLGDLGFQARLMQGLEESGQLDPALEYLPSPAEIAQRQRQGQPLVRPELAVLLAYSKIELKTALIDSGVPDDPYFADTLLEYFPPLLRERFAEEIARHRLRREIIVTELANELINRGGSTMFLRLKEETGHTAADITLAFIAAKAVFDLDALYAEIDRLDNQVAGWFQLDLYLKVQDALRQQTAWFLRLVSRARSIAEIIETYCAGIASIRKALVGEILTEEQRVRLDDDRAALVAAGLSDDLALELASLSFLADAPDAILVADAVKRPAPKMAALFAQASAFFRVDDLRRAAEKLLLTDYFDRLAINSLRGVLSVALRGVVRDIVKRGKDEPSFAAWYERNRVAVGRAREGIDEILSGGELNLSRLMVAATYLRDLVPA